MTFDFKKYVQSGEIFLKKLAVQLGDPEDTAKAGRILRAVLHVFRDQSTPQESVQMIAQLPMSVKAIYVDGWRIGQQQKRIRHPEHFLHEVQEADRSIGRFDFPNENATEHAVKAVFHVIKEYVSEGEMADMISTLPKKLRPLMEEA